MRLIDADALIQEIKENNEGYYFNSSAEREANFAKVNYAIDRISEAPTVEYTFEEAFQKTVCEQRLYCPERPQGEWEWVQYDANPNIGNWHCSECRYIPHGKKEYQKTNFCPNCGADMRGGSK